MNNQPQHLDLDAILQTKAPALYKRMPCFVVNYMKRKIHVDELNEILTIYADKQGVDFMQASVDYFNLDLKVHGLEVISKTGRYIFVSNHPLGGLDGICLAAIVGRYFDKKIKYMVNDVLYFIKNLQPIFLPINRYGAQMKDVAKITNDAFASDEQIITFPAGLCSRKQNGEIYDTQWHKNFVQKAIEYKRDVVPVYFEGHNSNFFYRFANIRKQLGIKFNVELFFLPDEMFKNKNSSFAIVFGEPISYSVFDGTKNASQWAEYVKEVSYGLKSKLK